MTHASFKMIEKNRYRDGSPSEEGEKELLNFFTTIKPEMEELCKSQMEYASRMIRFSENIEVNTWKKNK